MKSQEEELTYPMSQNKLAEEPGLKPKSPFFSYFPSIPGFKTGDGPESIIWRYGESQHS